MLVVSACRNCGFDRNIVAVEDVVASKSLVKGGSGQKSCKSVALMVRRGVRVPFVVVFIDHIAISVATAMLVVWWHMMMTVSIVG